MTLHFRRRTRLREFPQHKDDEHPFPLLPCSVSLATQKMASHEVAWGAERPRQRLIDGTLHRFVSIEKGEGMPKHDMAAAGWVHRTTRHEVRDDDDGDDLRDESRQQHRCKTSPCRCRDRRRGLSSLMPCVAFQGRLVPDRTWLALHARSIHTLSPLCSLLAQERENQAFCRRVVPQPSAYLPIASMPCARPPLPGPGAGRGDSFVTVRLA